MNKKLMFLLFCTSSSFIYSMNLYFLTHEDICNIKPTIPRKELYNKISEILPHNSSILQLGGSSIALRLNGQYSLTSMGDNWYNDELLEKKLSNQRYDLIFVDETASRGNFVRRLKHILNLNVPIIINGTHCSHSYGLLVALSKHLNRKHEIIEHKDIPRRYEGPEIYDENWRKYRNACYFESFGYIAKN